MSVKERTPVSKHWRTTSLSSKGGNENFLKKAHNEAVDLIQHQEEIG
jgi:hypothetical protein